MIGVRRVRVRGEAGHTLVELLAAMAIGSIVLTALMMVFVNGLNGALRVSDRTESTARARVALERMTSVLDSQVCLVQRVTLSDGSTSDVNVPPVAPGSSDTSVTFYADLAGAGLDPNEFTYTYDAVARTLTELQHRGTGDMPTRTYPAQPTVRRMLADDVVPTRDAANAVLPVFRYYAFEADGSVDEAKPLTTPLSADDAGRVVRVAVTFQANPARTHAGDARRTVLAGAGTLATANPTDGITCP